jgi:hypothetical protein
VVAAYALRRDTGMAPGTVLPGLSRVRWPLDAEAGPSRAAAGEGGRGGNGPEWARGYEGDDAAEGAAEAAAGEAGQVGEPGAGPGPGMDVIEVEDAVRGELAAHRHGLEALQAAAEASEATMLEELNLEEEAAAGAGAEVEVEMEGGRASGGGDCTGGWTARALGPCSMHLRHGLTLVHFSAQRKHFLLDRLGGFGQTDGSRSADKWTSVRPCTEAPAQSAVRMRVRRVDQLRGRQGPSLVHLSSQPRALFVTQEPKPVLLLKPPNTSHKKCLL